MKKVVLIPDSFKGTMSSAEIISIMKERIEAYNPGCQTVSIPVADGGEGSVDAFLTALGGEKVRMRTKGPWNEEVDSFYGMLPDGTAVIEMAASAGLPQVGDRKDPSRTTTYGVGELILAAARNGAKRLVIGLGGSATNDAGCGAAAACGVRFLDKDGRSFVPVGDTLGDIASIDLSGMDGKVKEYSCLPADMNSTLSPLLSTVSEQSSSQPYHSWWVRSPSMSISSETCPWSFTMESPWSMLKTRAMPHCTSPSHPKTILSSSSVVHTKWCSPVLMKVSDLDDRMRSLSGLQIHWHFLIFNMSGIIL